MAVRWSRHWLLCFPWELPPVFNDALKKKEAFYCTKAERRELQEGRGAAHKSPSPSLSLCLPLHAAHTF